MNFVEQLLSGLAATLVVFGGFFVRELIRTGENGSLLAGFKSRFLARTSWRGVLWVISLPGFWLLLFYGLVLHIRIALGRWPAFGESVKASNWLLGGHLEAVGMMALVLVASLYFLPAVLVASLCRSSWNYVVLYVLTYAVALGVAFGLVFLAPAPFLNWLFD
jgi:hypothetical protein